MMHFYMYLEDFVNQSRAENIGGRAIGANAAFMQQYDSLRVGGGQV